MMKKLLLLIVLLIPALTGCGNSADETTAMQSEFNVSFNKLNKENKTAKFTVNGFANEEEFNQLETIIIDSMDEQDVTGDYTVKVYSQIQDNEGEPTYGTVHYNNGKLSKNELANITIEEYTSILNQ